MSPSLALTLNLPKINGRKAELTDYFDLIAGTSTGAIIAFLIGLRLETISEAGERYAELIKKIFIKSTLASTKMIFTTATYSHLPFQEILQSILGDDAMIEGRGDPKVPLVFAVSSKMSVNPSRIALFRNYNYFGCGVEGVSVGEATTTTKAEKKSTEFSFESLVEEDGQHAKSTTTTTTTTTTTPPTTFNKHSRHLGSFRIPQRLALRATTAAPTVFKPVLLNEQLYCDGGIVASNPCAIAIHEAACIFPDVPVELVVSLGTGTFSEEPTAGRFGWDNIIAQIVNSACDAEQTHHVMEDTLAGGAVKYYRFNPLVGGPNEFGIDLVEDEKLEKLREISREYTKEEKVVKEMKEIGALLRKGGPRKN